VAAATKQLIEGGSCRTDEKSASESKACGITIVPLEWQRTKQKLQTTFMPVAITPSGAQIQSVDY
jgi:hypothetical protein